MARNLIGDIKHSDGTPYQNVTLYLTLVNGTYNTNNEHFIGETKPYKTDSGGRVTIPVTPNTGVQPSYYILRLPDNKKITFTIPEGTSDIDLDTVREAGVLPTDPEYTNVLEYLEQYVDDAIAEIEIVGGATPAATATVAGKVKTSATVTDPVVPLVSDLDNFYSSSEIDAFLSDKVDTSTLNIYYSAEDVDNLLNAKVDTSALSNYYTQTQVNTLLDGKVNNSTLSSGYYTQTQVNNLLANYYTETEIDGLLNGKVSTSTLNSYYLRTEVDTLLAGKLNSNDPSVTNSRTPTGTAGGDLGGTYPNPTINTVPIAKGGTGATTAATARTNLSVPAISDLTNHTGNTSNPHNVTPGQVGNTTAQWNANQIQGVPVSTTTPTTGQILKFNGTQYAPANDETASGGGGGGETNTASNVGVGGVGVFKQKTGVNLEFRNINAASNRVAVTLDAANNEIDIDVNQSNLALTSISGTLTVDKGGTGATTAANARTNLSVPAISDLTNHTGNTSNPHSVTAAQVGAIATTARGAANGVASLDAGGLIPDSQIPPGITRDTELTAHTSLTNNPHSVTAAQVGAIATSEKGANNGVASLDSGGDVPDSQIPATVARLAVAQQFTASQGVTANTLTFSATPTANLNLSNRYYLTLTGNVSVFDASNLREGMFIFHFIQDATGGRTLSFAPKFRFIGTAPTLSTAANARDILSCDCDGTNLYCVLNKGW